MVGSASTLSIYISYMFLKNLSLTNTSFPGREINDEAQTLTSSILRVLL